MDFFKNLAEGAASNLKNVADKAKSATEEVAANAASVANTVVSNASDVAGNIASGVSETANNAVSSVSRVLEDTGAANVINGAAEAVVSSVSETANTVISGASGVIEAGAEFIKENSPAAQLKRVRLNGFKDGINQGAYLVGQQRYNFYYAYLATLCFFLRQDGELSSEEEQWLDEGLSHLKLNGGIPDEVKEKLHEIARNEEITFGDASKYLDKVSLVSLESIVESTEMAIDLDGVVTDEELEARKQLEGYIDSRTAGDREGSVDWAKEAIEASVAEYSENYDKVNEEFKEKTRLQDADIAFLMGATALQVARVLIINALTDVEAAGKGKKEEALHNFQEKIFNNISANEQELSNRLYASTQQILTTPGVPYDATNTEGKLQGLFKGSNHRFATLGHDPVLGLVFGTSNIMTNTITCVKSLGFMGMGVGIPVTYPVQYSPSNGNPHISAIPAGTVEMLTASAKRVGKEPVAAAASLIKQLIHIGTDLYTPLGIQLPLANIVLDNKHAQKLTDYISTGDILKVGAQAGMTVLINWLIAALHGSSLIFKEDNEAFALETYQVRTKKIIMISDTIATSSSVIQSVITKNPKCFDLGGAAILIYRMFTDMRFIAKVKEDFINSKLNDIYEERAKGILYQ